MPIVRSGLFEINGRKYIDIDGLQIKIPWRYDRIIGVEIIGLKSIHELRTGDIIKNFSFETKKWNGDTFYVLKSITTE